MAADVFPFEYGSAWEAARRVASMLSRFVSGVFIGGTGTDWMRDPAYPFAVVFPSNETAERGHLSQTITARICGRLDAGGSKPEALDGGNVYQLPGARNFYSMVAAAAEFLGTGEIGAPVESINVDFSDDFQAPVMVATITITLSDSTAFGDSF